MGASRAKRGERAERTTLRAERRALRVVRVRQCAALHHVLRKLRESLRERGRGAHTDDGDTREVAGELLCETTLSSLDAAIVTRRRRRMTSFAFPSGGAPTGASLHLRRPLRRRRPGTEYADCTYGSDCADCGPPALPASSAHVRRDVQLGFRRRFRRRRRPRRRARHRLLPTGQTTPVARFGLHRSVGSLSWVRTPRCLGPSPPECLAHLTYTCFARSLSALFEQIPAEEALEASVRRGEARCRARIAAAP